MTKYIFYIIFAVFLLGTAFYTGLLQQLPVLIATINSEYIAYIPPELRVFILLIVFIILFGLVSVFT